MEILTESARRLASAVIVRAVLDATSSDVEVSREATEWLAGPGAEWLSVLGVADPSATRRVVGRGLPPSTALSRRAGRLKEASARRKRPKDDGASAGYMLRHEVAKVDKAAVRFLRSRGQYAGLPEPEASPEIAS